MAEPSFSTRSANYLRTRNWRCCACSRSASSSGWVGGSRLIFIKSSGGSHVQSLASTVIAPDLPGIGDSDIPKDGLDMAHAASRVHALVSGLGIQKAAVVGHDIGLMVAYAYAAQFPSEVEKLVLMDAFLPGVNGWEAIYNNPAIWHFRFNGPTPEALVQGRERIYFEHFWNDFAADKAHSIPEGDRQA